MVGNTHEKETRSDFFTFCPIWDWNRSQRGRSGTRLVDRLVDRLVEMSSQVRQTAQGQIISFSVTMA